MARVLDSGPPSADWETFARIALLLVQRVDWIPAFARNDAPLSDACDWIPAFAGKTCCWGSTLLWIPAFARNDAPLSDACDWIPAFAGKTRRESVAYSSSVRSWFPVGKCDLTVLDSGPPSADWETFARKDLLLVQPFLSAGPFRRRRKPYRAGVLPYKDWIPAFARNDAPLSDACDWIPAFAGKTRRESVAYSSSVRSWFPVGKCDLTVLDSGPPSADWETFARNDSLLVQPFLLAGPFRRRRKPYRAGVLPYKDWIPARHRRIGKQGSFPTRRSAIGTESVEQGISSYKALCGMRFGEITPIAYGILLLTAGHLSYFLKLEIAVGGLPIYFSLGTSCPAQKTLRINPLLSGNLQNNIPGKL